MSESTSVRIEPDPDEETTVLARSNRPIEDATWVQSPAEGTGVRFDPTDATLEPSRWVTTDLLVTGGVSVEFEVEFSSRSDEYAVRFRLLPECQVRLRVPLCDLVGAGESLEREGGLLQPRAAGDRVDPTAVDRLELRVAQAESTPVEWCCTPLRVQTTEPPTLDDPALPAGPLLDEFGQSTVREWPDKTETGEELVTRLRGQAERAVGRSDDGVDSAEIASRSDWGGWTEGPRFDATGRFRTAHDGDRWWLVDPDGYPFWSHGVCCARPYPETRFDELESALTMAPAADGEYAPALSDGWDHAAASRGGGSADSRVVNYQVANLIRAFGPDDWRDAWERIVDGELRQLGLTTAGAWSDWRWASAAGWPYVRTLPLSFDDVATVAWDFPDVFDPAFEAAAERIAAPLAETADDPALVGYFVGNEPGWAWTQELPAWELLRSTETCATRRAFASWLRNRYDSESALADAWGTECAFADVASGRWTGSLPAGAVDDLRAFSERMAAEFYETLLGACRRVDGEHLCLGTRFPWRPPDWAVAGMDGIDAICINCFSRRVPDAYRELCEQLGVPLLVGEFQFGALDVGLPAPGVQQVPDQRSRADAYRTYVEDAASKPWCVGAHWYGLTDHSALGKDNGGNFNTGLYDVCNRPYEAVTDAVRSTSAELYAVANGDREPVEIEPTYLGVYLQ